MTGYREIPLSAEEAEAAEKNWRAQQNSGWLATLKEQIAGKRDPAFAGMPAFRSIASDEMGLASSLGYSLKDTAALTPAQRLSVLKNHLGDRFLSEEKDANGYDVVTFKNKSGDPRSAYVATPGLDRNDVARAAAQSVPFLLAAPATGAAAAAVGAGRVGAALVGAGSGAAVSAATQLAADPLAGTGGVDGGAVLGAAAGGALPAAAGLAKDYAAKPVLRALDRVAGDRLSAAAGVVSEAASPVVARLRQQLGLPPAGGSVSQAEASAAKQVAAKFEQDGKSVDRVAADMRDLIRGDRAAAGDRSYMLNARGLQEAPQAVMLADAAGENTRGLMRAALNRPNDARSGFAQALDDRQRTQHLRLNRAIGDNVADPEAYARTVEDLATRRGAQARAEFTHAYTEPMPYTRGLRELSRVPRFNKLAQDAEEAIYQRTGDRPNLTWASRRVEGEPMRGASYATAVPTTEGVHVIRQELNDQIAAATRSTDNASRRMVPELMALRSRLDRALDGTPLAEAIANYADSMAVTRAAEAGRRAGLKESTDDFAALIAGVGAPERDAFRLGLSRSLAEKNMSGNLMDDKLSRLMGSPQAEQNLREALGFNAAAHHGLQAVHAAESAMTATRRAATGNSTTAKQMAEQADAAERKGLLRSLANGVTGAKDWAVKQVENAAADPAVSGATLRLLQSTDPDRLRFLLDAVAREQARRARSAGHVGAALASEGGRHGGN